MPQGAITWFDNDRGYGFIAPDAAGAGSCSYANRPSFISR